MVAEETKSIYYRNPENTVRQYLNQDEEDRCPDVVAFDEWTQTRPDDRELRSLNVVLVHIGNENENNPPRSTGRIYEVSLRLVFMVL